MIRPPPRVDTHYLDPRLAELYHVENGFGPDTGFYVALAEELGARTILDLGCGTGTLARALAIGDRRVVGVDPAPAMLAVARGQPCAECVRWVEGDSSALGAPGADLVLMTGNVAQIFLEDEDWHRVLRDIHAALRPGGHLAFESRNPDDEPWRRWNREATFHRLDSRFGPVEAWLELVGVAGSRVAFRHHYRFGAADETVVTASELRFRSLAELTRSLTETGFSVERAYGGWDRRALDADSRVIVVIARR